MELDLDTLEQPRTRWLDCGGVRFLIRYATPKEAERFRRMLIAQGIAGKEDGLPHAGREDAYFLAIARQYVIGWEGVTQAGAPTEYAPEKMAKVLANHGIVFRAVAEAIKEIEVFFTESGASATKN